MKKTILILLSAIALGIGGAFAQHGHPKPARKQEQPPKQRYTCPMHPEVVRTEPGQCPKCGMTLVPLKEEKKLPTPKANDHATHDANGMAMPHHQTEHEQEHEMKMQSSVNVADPMSRESSGTSWVPDSTPMYGRMWMFGDDMLMLHGGIFPRYTNV